MGKYNIFFAIKNDLQTYSHLKVKYDCKQIHPE